MKKVNASLFCVSTTFCVQPNQLLLVFLIVKLFSGLIEAQTSSFLFCSSFASSLLINFLCSANLWHYQHGSLPGNITAGKIFIDKQKRNEQIMLQHRSGMWGLETGEQFVWWKAAGTSGHHGKVWNPGWRLISFSLIVGSIIWNQMAQKKNHFSWGHRGKVFCLYSANKSHI